MEEPREAYHQLMVQTYCSSKRILIRYSALQRLEIHNRNLGCSDLVPKTFVEWNYFEVEHFVALEPAYLEQVDQNSQTSQALQLPCPEGVPSFHLWKSLSSEDFVHQVDSKHLDQPFRKQGAYH